MEAFHARRYADAVDPLGEYLARYPDDVDTLIAYAHARPLVVMANDVQEGQTVYALRQLLRIDLGKWSTDAVRIADVRLDAREQLMEIYARTGLYAEALDAANIVLHERLAAEGVFEDVSAAGTLDPTARRRLVSAISKGKGTLSAIGVRTHALLRVRMYPEALAACNLWIDAAPDDVEPALVRVELLRDDHRSARQAVDAAKKWSEKHASKTDNDLLLAHTDLLYSLVNFAGPADHSPAQSRPATAVDSSVATDRLVSYRDILQLLTRAATTNPASKTASRILAADLDSMGLTELARTVVTRMLLADPTDRVARYELIRRDWDSGHADKVLEVSAQIDDDSAPPYVVGLRAAALLTLGKKDLLQSSIKELRDRKDDPEAAAWAVVVDAGLRHSNADARRVLAACQAALTHNPADYYLRNFAAEAHLQLGERQAAIQEWQRVVGADPNWALPAVRLSNLLLESGRPEEALQTAGLAFSRSPMLGVLMIQAEAWVACIQAGIEKDPAGCLKLLDQITAAVPADSRVKVLKSTVLASTGEVDKAIETVNAALASRESLSEQSWIQFASLCHGSRVSRSDLARQCLERSQKENGISPALALAKAAALDDPKAGLASFDADAEAAAHSLTPSTQTSSPDSATESDLAGQPKQMAWDISRATYLELTHNQRAAQSWSALASAHQENLRLQLIALSVPSVRSNKEISALCLHNIEKLNGVTSDAYAVSRARYLVTFETFLDGAAKPTPLGVEARSRLDELVRKQPDSLELRLLSAQAFEKLGRSREAIDELRAAANLDPKSIPIRLNLARLLESVNDFDGLRELVNQLSVADLTEFADSSQRDNTATVLAEQGKIQRAITLLQDTQSANREAATAQLLLAKLYQRNGDPAAAGRILDKLLADKPSAATLAFAADFFASQHQAARSIEVLQQLDKDPEAKPGLAERIRAEFELRNDPVQGPQKAVALLEQATTKASSDPLNWRALSALRLALNDPQKSLDAATRGLKFIPTDSTLKLIADHPKMLPAVTQPELRPFLLALVNDPSGGAATQSLLKIYDANNDKKPLSQEAVDLRSLAAQNPRFVPLQVYLVRLYYSRLRQIDDALALAAEAMRATPDSSAIHQVRIEALMAAAAADDQNQQRAALRLQSTEQIPPSASWNEVLSAANDWKKSIPSDTPQANIAAADALVKLRRPAEAVALLKPMVDAARSQADFDVLSKPYIDILSRYLSAAKFAGIQLPTSELLAPFLSRGGIGKIYWMQLSAASLKSPKDADAWLAETRATLPEPTSRDAVLQYIALSEIDRELFQKTHNETYKQQGRQLITQLLQSPKPEPQVFAAMARTLDEDGDWNGAIAYYQKLLAITPGDPTLQNNLAMDLARVGRAPEAVSLITAAVNAVPGSPELRDSRAYVLSQAGQVELAVSDQREAIRLNPLEARFRLRLIQILFDAHRLHDAAVELKSMDSNTDTSLLSDKQTAQYNDLKSHLTGVAAGAN